jgi:hypothetical protein
MKVDAVIKERAEQEEAEGKYGDERSARFDRRRDPSLPFGLAVSSPSKAVGSASTWDRMETEVKKEEG